jgi:PAS domain-containing protein/CheY-like chemotaxis protein
MARRFEQYTKFYESSRIPFLAVEIVTNGKGDMVDLVCRFANDAAARLLDRTPQSMNGQRFSRNFPADRLAALAPFSAVAFSGSSASFPYETVLGETLNVSCYQLQYGVCACILDRPDSAGASERSGTELLLPDGLAGGTLVLEVGGGVRILSCGQQLYTLTGYSHQEFLNRFSQDLSLLILPEDWQGVLQELLDAVRSGHTLNCEFRIVQKSGESVWVSMQAERVSAAANSAVFHALLFSTQGKHQDQEALAQSLEKAAALESQLSGLYEAIPCASALFSVSADGVPVPVQISAALCELLGYTQAELLKRLGADPKWRVIPEDREPFSVAWNEALHARAPELHFPLRMQKKGGGVLRIRLDAAIRPQADGRAWLYAVYTDETEAWASRTALRYTLEQNDLFLMRPECLALDYDPLSDTARFSSLGPNRRTFVRTVPDYSRALSESVAAGYRETVFSALREARSKPCRGSFCYLGCYNGQDYRWYQATYVSLADSSGSVCRIVAVLEDVSVARRQAEQYRRHIVHWSAMAEDALAAAQLDLTGGRILNARSRNSHLLMVLFGNSAAECLSGLQRNIPLPEEQAKFAAAFSVNALLAASQGGRDVPSLDHGFYIDAERTIHTVSTAVTLVENPESHHIEAEVLLTDVDFRRRCTDVWGALTGSCFDFVLTIDAETRRYRSYGGGLVPADGPDFYNVALEQIEAHVLPAERRKIRAAILLPSILRYLKRQPFHEFIVSARTDTGAVRYEQFRFSWLNEAEHELLLTGMDITQYAEVCRRREQELTTSLEQVRTELNAQTHKLSRLRGKSTEQGESQDSPLPGCRLLSAPLPENLIDALTKAGCIVETAQTGLDALQRFAAQPAHRFSAVLLTPQLPVMDGSQTAAGIRGWEKSDAQTIPIFLLGGKADPSILYESAPAEPQALLQLLTQRLGGQPS